MIPGDSNGNITQVQAAKAAPRVAQYRVCKGDSLSGIADKFNVSVNDIIAWNSLHPEAYLQPGQRLTLHASGG